MSYPSDVFPSDRPIAADLGSPDQLSDITSAGDDEPTTAQTRTMDNMIDDTTINQRNNDGEMQGEVPVQTIIMVQDHQPQSETHPIPSYTFDRVASSSNYIPYLPMTQPPTYQTHAPLCPPSDGNLPQDIQHIIDSNFASASANPEEERRAELNRIADELRVKVRMSRYQRAQEQLHAREDDKSDSSADEDDEEQVEEEEVHQHLNNDLIDGSGDEQAISNQRSEEFARLKVEVDRMISVPAPPGPLENETSIRQAPSEYFSTLSPLDSTMDPSAQYHPEIQPSSFAEDESRNLLTDIRVDPPQPVPDPTSILPPAQETSVHQVRKPRRKRGGRRKTRGQTDNHAGQEDDDEDGDGPSDVEQDLGAIGVGPRTENEISEFPAEVTNVSFDRLSSEEMGTMVPFGMVASLIQDVLVIQGTTGLGPDQVLDEGSVVFDGDGIVIGKLYDVFGSVSDPHYSIILPSHSALLVSSSEASQARIVGTTVYYVPSHSNFVFKSELRAQPRGTDASNLFDEEPANPDEVEFSDDEAEAAYTRSLKLARKAAAAEKGKEREQVPEQGMQNVPVLSEEGRTMFVKHPSEVLNYDEEGEVTDYNLLRRPRGGLDYNTIPEPGPSSANQNGPTRSRRGRDAARGGTGAKASGKRRTRPRNRSGPQPAQPIRLNNSSRGVNNDPVNNNDSVDHSHNVNNNTNVDTRNNVNPNINVDQIINAIRDTNVVNRDNLSNIIDVNTRNNPNNTHAVNHNNNLNSISALINNRGNNMNGFAVLNPYSTPLTPEDSIEYDPRNVRPMGRPYNPMGSFNLPNNTQFGFSYPNPILLPPPPQQQQPMLMTVPGASTQSPTLYLQTMGFPQFPQTGHYNPNFFRPPPR